MSGSNWEGNYYVVQKVCFKFVTEFIKKIHMVVTCHLLVYIFLKSCSIICQFLALLFNYPKHQLCSKYADKSDTNLESYLGLISERTSPSDKKQPVSIIGCCTNQERTQFILKVWKKQWRSNVISHSYNNLHQD